MGYEDELNREDSHNSEFSEVRNMLLRLRKIKASDNFRNRLKQRIISELSGTNFLDNSTDALELKPTEKNSINKKSSLPQFWFFQRSVFTTSVIIGIILLIIFSIYNLTESPKKQPVITQLNKESSTPPVISDTLSKSFKDTQQLKEQVDKLKESPDKSLIAENTKSRKHSDNKLKDESTNNKSLTEEEALMPKSSNPVEKKGSDATPEPTIKQPETYQIPKEPTAVDTKKEPTTRPGILAMPKSDTNATKGQKTKKIPKQKINDEEVTKEQLEKIKEEILDKIKKEF